jgi:outer membrane receptor protein involved in Fe transport
MRCKWLILAVVAVMATAGAYAQTTTGAIEGTVLDENGVALPGVSVEGASPALQGTKLAVTDASGKFRMMLLPPGTYHLKFSLSGFATTEQAEIRVGLGRTVTLQVQLSSAFREEVVVTGGAPLVDTRGTTVGINIGEEVFKDLAVGRSFQALAFLAPGVVGGGLGNNPSVGGSSAAENRYVVDGLDTTDPAFGTVGTSVNYSFIQEVQVKTGGYEAEYSGALGGVVNVITKSGGNELSGSMFAYYTDDSLQGDVPETSSFGRRLGYTEYDFGADLGGKLIQDKLWYFIAVNPSRTDEDVENRGGTKITSKDESLYYAGKLTWQVNPSNQVVVSLFGDPTDVEDWPVMDAVGYVVNNFEEGARNYSVALNSSLSSNLFFEARAGRVFQTDRWTPESDQPRYQDYTSDLQWLNASGCGSGGRGSFFHPGCVGGTFVTEDGDRFRNEALTSLSWFASDAHELKFGAMYRQLEYRDFSYYPGRDLSPLIDSTGYVVDPGGLAGQRYHLYDGSYSVIEYDQNSLGETTEYSLYLQDAWRVTPHFTIRAGVRFDGFKSEGDGSATDNLRKLDFSLEDMIAPRVGVIWDFAKNGRSKAYAHYGKFFESVPLDINVRAFGQEQFNFYYFYYPEDGSLPSAGNHGEFYYAYLLGAGTKVDPNTKPMYLEEIVGGVEYEVARNFVVGIKGVYRTLGDVIEDISVDGGHTYFITNPGGVYTHNPVTGEELDEAAVFPKAERKYRAVELTAQKRFSNNWQMFGSYVYSKNEGNYGGLFRQDNGQLDPNITSLFDLPSLLIGAYGLLPNDRTHVVKAYTSYLWKFGLVTGVNAEYYTGTPISKLGAHNVYGRRERFVTQRGSAGRTPDIWKIDLHLEYPIKIGGLSLSVIGDIFNVTDNEKATAVDQEWTFRRAGATTDPNECGGPGTGPGTACPSGNPNFGQASTYQSPRTIRLALKLAF